MNQQRGHKGSFIQLMVEKPTNLTPFRQLNLTIGSWDRLTPSFLIQTYLLIRVRKGLT
jgi:hypothetical protein